MMNLFDGILYINLAKRKDRRKNLEAELLRVGADPQKVFRIEGYHDELNGTRGCLYSHIEALEFAIIKGWKNVLILEDDCRFTANKEQIDLYIRNFLQFFQENWDVFFLGTLLKISYPTAHEEYLRVLFSFHSHAYAVNGPYLPKLKDHFCTIYDSMREDLFFTSSLEKALDRQWITLQLSDRWLVGKQMIARQGRSYSDIEKEVKPHRLYARLYNL